MEAPSADKPKKRARAKNWEWDDSIMLVELVDKHGKAWGKILGIMHNEQHRIPDIQDPQVLRRHYNSLKDKLGKPYVPTKPKFTRKGMNQAQIKAKDAELATQERQKQQQWEAAAKTIKRIEDGEIVRTTDNAESEKEIRDKMKEKAEERKAVRDERLKNHADIANEERAWRSSITNAFGLLGGLLEQSIIHERLLIVALTGQEPPPFERKRGRDDEEKEEKEEKETEQEPKKQKKDK